MLILDGAPCASRPRMTSRMPMRVLRKWRGCARRIRRANLGGNAAQIYDRSLEFDRSIAAPVIGLRRIGVIRIAIARAVIGLRLLLLIIAAAVIRLLLPVGRLLLLVARLLRRAVLRVALVVGRRALLIARINRRRIAVVVAAIGLVVERRTLLVARSAVSLVVDAVIRRGVRIRILRGGCARRLVLRRARDIRRGRAARRRSAPLAC